MKRFGSAIALIGALTLGAAPAHAEAAGGHLPALVLASLAFQQVDFAPVGNAAIAPAAPRLMDQTFRLDADVARIAVVAPAEPAGAPLKLGPAPRLAPGLLDQAPRLGLFDLTFASDVPAGGNDPMFNAEIVVALTRRF